ncbi:hypothetical protein TrST_g3677 [Triparma strigata]|uniref:Uncharacterized protein n=1 Tax=Triparma strigata TaxID=1606541 RepID=A0A9W7BE78_9STRA|nr:hypothetical protein TrST_g3677 [Triparma strigata]
MNGLGFELTFTRVESNRPHLFDEIKKTYVNETAAKKETIVRLAKLVTDASDRYGSVSGEEAHVFHNCLENIIELIESRITKFREDRLQPRKEISVFNGASPVVEEEAEGQPEMQRKKKKKKKKKKKDSTPNEVNTMVGVGVTIGAEGEFVMKASTFVGPRKGEVYKVGSKGVGYYKDLSYVPSAVEVVESSDSDSDGVDLDESLDAIPVERGVVKRWVDNLEHEDWDNIFGDGVSAQDLEESTADSPDEKGGFFSLLKRFGSFSKG